MVNQVVQTQVDPKVTNFGLGYPSPDLLPDAVIAPAMSQYQHHRSRNLILQYSFIAGYEDFRVKLSNFIKIASGRDVDPENLFVSNGISGSLHLVCSVLAQAGDLVFVEETSYFFGIKLFKSLGFREESVTTREHGVDFEYLEARLAKGEVPKFFYLIPFSHNPRGYNWSCRDRERIVELAQQYNFHIVSDEVYEYLHFQTRHPYGSFHQTPNDRVVSLNTFSKILAPGLRLGWIEAHRDFLNKLQAHPVIVSGGCVNPMGCIIVENLLEFALIQHLEQLRKTLTTRRNALVESLNKHFGDRVKFDVPGGGYFVWVEFDDDFVSDDKFAKFLLEDYGVKFQPGKNFNLDGNRFLNCARFSFSYYNPEQIDQGIERLARGYQAFQAKGIGYPLSLRNQSVAPSSPGQVTESRPLMVHGYRGRMGSAIMNETEFARQHGFRLVGVERSLEGLEPNGVVIDVSSPDGLSNLIDHLTGQSLLIGTTGQLPYAKLKQYQTLTGAKVKVASNFSPGIATVQQMLECVDSMWQADIVELHHSQKRDNPSGTALSLVDSLGKAPLGSVHGIRPGSNYGEHLVVLQRDGEKIELRHQCLDRKIFGQGAILLASKLAKLAG